MKKEIIIDGNNFSNMDEFYNEIENKFTKELEWRIGRNLDAFNDVLSGGFGVFECDEPVVIKWVNSNKSKEDLSYGLTISELKKILKKCHPSHIQSINRRIQDLELNRGDTLFDDIIDIIKSNKHIELVLE